MPDTVATLFIESLVAQGIRHLFTIPGTDTLPLYEALQSDRRIECVFIQHEASGAFAADAYFKSGDTMASCFVVPGPGGTNLLTGVDSAYRDRTPMLAFTSQIPRAKLGRQAVHDCDLTGIYASSVKAQFVLDDAATMLDTLARAARVAREQPSGPVQVIVQVEIMSQPAPPRPATMPVEAVTPPVAPNAASVDAAAATLASAKNPIIYAGRGALDAAAEVRRLAETLRAPVLTSLHARGIIPEDDSLVFGHLYFQGAEDILEQADACIAIGTRFSEYSAGGWRWDMPQPLVRIDADPSSIDLNYPAAVGVVGDAKTAVPGLLERLTPRSGDSAVLQLSQRLRSGYRGELTAFMAQRQTSPLHPLWVAKTVRDATPADTIFITDGTSTQTWPMEQAFTITHPRTHVFPEVSQTMGYGPGGALGAALACPDRPVVAFLGDGSLTMQLGELRTLARLQRSVVLVVFHDRFYNALRVRQEHIYGRDGSTGHEYFGVELGEADFAAVARALGLNGVTCDTAESLVPALKDALAADRPTLLDVWTDPHPLSRYYQYATGQLKARRKAA